MSSLSHFELVQGLVGCLILCVSNEDTSLGGALIVYFTTKYDGCIGATIM